MSNEWSFATYGGLYGKGMHDFVMRETEVGWRVASAEDSERCGWSAINDLQYVEYCREQGWIQ